MKWDYCELFLVVVYFRKFGNKIISGTVNKINAIEYRLV